MTLPLAQVRVHCLDNSKHTIIFLLSSTADYTPLVSSELTFGPTASTGSTQYTSVSLVDDDIVEDTEQFSVEVSSTSDIVLIASPSFAVYSIADDLDSKLPSLITVKIVIPLVSLSLYSAAVVVSMEDSTYSVDENSGVVEVCADLLIGELEGVDAVVQLTTQSSTASEPCERLVTSLVAFVVACFNPCSLPLSVLLQMTMYHRILSSHFPLCLAQQTVPHTAPHSV